MSEEPDPETVTRRLYRIYLDAGKAKLSDAACREIAELLGPRIERACLALYPLIGEDWRDAMANSVLHQILQTFIRNAIAPATVQELNLILGGCIRNMLMVAYREQVQYDHPAELDARMVDRRTPVSETAVEELLADLPDRVYAFARQRARFDISDGALRYAVDCLLNNDEAFEPQLLVSFDNKRPKALAPFLREHVEILVRDALYRFRAQVMSGVLA